MTSTSEIDEYDRKILRALQENADYSMAELGEKVGLSHTPCWRRIKRLEADGIILNRVTLLDRHKLNLNVSLLAQINMTKHDQITRQSFELAVLDIREVVECYSTSGEKDYVLKIVVRDLAEYEELLKSKLLSLPGVASISSNFALRQVKYTTELPL
ncbi:Lrp/AsnC family transcriptional regulator [Sessilibacter sp. MAH1]